MKYFVPLAETYRSLGYLDEAIQVLQDGLKWHPGYVIGRAILAQTYFQMGHTIQAALEAEAVVRLDAQNILGWRIFVRATHKLGEVHKTAYGLKQILYIIPGDAEALQMQQRLKITKNAVETPKAASQSRVEDFHIQRLGRRPQLDKKIDSLNRLLIRVQAKMVTSTS